MTKFRSAASLLASGAATITLDQRIRLPEVKSTMRALEADRRNIAADAKRANRRLSHL